MNTPTDRCAIQLKAFTRRSLLVMTSLAAAMLISSWAPAFSQGGIDIDVAPPAARVVATPARRPGFVWAPGYYRWDGHRHVWVDGRFIRERRGSHWVPERWNEHHGRYRFVPGHWERD